MPCHRRQVGDLDCLGDTSFITEYQRNIKNAIDLGLEASPIAAAVKELLSDGTIGFIPGRWEGTATELLTKLDERVSYQQYVQKSYPKSAKALSNRLRRDAPAMRVVGIDVEFQKSGSVRVIKFSPVNNR
ncbi:MAG: hypothetical protein HQ567_34110 [Candidatus Nealsonbacteria bacterium]|nr:hypothetical protein [Candidatus Nealsonbacteria bacterium]